MTACPECGGDLDPDVTHVQHVDGCPNAEVVTFRGPDMARCAIAWLQSDHDGCDCPEVCADCCQDPDCPLREPQETP